MPRTSRKRRRPTEWQEVGEKIDKMLAKMKRTRQAPPGMQNDFIDACSKAGWSREEIRRVLLTIVSSPSELHSRLRTYDNPASRSRSMSSQLEMSA